MFTLDKLNLAYLRLLFLAVNFKVNLAKVYVEVFLSIRLLSRKLTYPQISEQLTVKLNLECFEYVAPEQHHRYPNSSCWSTDEMAGP